MTTRSNSPESEALTLADAEIFENARGAILQLKKTFETWIVIGRAVQRARKIADDRGGRQTFQRLLEQQGLAKVVSQKATWTRLLQIMEALPEVMAWHQTLTEKQQIEWAGPGAVFKHCPTFAKPNSERVAPTKPSAKQEVEQLKAHIAELEAARPQRSSSRGKGKRSVEDIVNDIREDEFTIDQLQAIAASLNNIANTRMREAKAKVRKTKTKEMAAPDYRP